MDRKRFYDFAQSLPIVNTHSHHLPDEEHPALNLAEMFRNSYLNWCGVLVPSGESEEEIAHWLDAVRTRSYFVWLERALMELYGIDEHLHAGSWEIFDRAVRQAHQDRDWHLKILRENCRYEAVLLDAYWSPGSHAGHPELFRPAYRVNSIFYGYDDKAVDHNDHNFQAALGVRTRDIEEYTRLIKHTLREKKQAGCSVLKCAIAYDRSLCFGKGTKEQAQKAMLDHPEPRDIEAFQDYVFDCICETAVELGMPVQIHTGLGLMDRSGAMQLQPLIARHPQTTFWLMHGSYPWTSDIAGLVHAYPNVWADLCWLPLLSPAAAHRLMHELIDVCNADRVVWGCDTWTSEESYGARLAFLDVLSRVLAERVESGIMRENDALRYAEAVLHDNAAGILKS